MTEAEKTQTVELIDNECQRLLEHFDSVQIFVSMREKEGDRSWSLSRGAGNWFTRYGQIQLWVERQNAIERKNALDDNKEIEDEGVY